MKHNEQKIKSHNFKKKYNADRRKSISFSGSTNLRRSFKDLEKWFKKLLLNFKLTFYIKCYHHSSTFIFFPKPFHVMYTFLKTHPNIIRRHSKHGLWYFRSYLFFIYKLHTSKFLFNSPKQIFYWRKLWSCWWNI